MVGDIEDQHSLGLDAPYDGEEVLLLGQRQNRRRLVEDQDPRIEGKCARDLHELLLGNTQRADFGVWIELEAETGKKCAGPIGQLAPVDEAERAPRLAPEKDVAGDGELRNEAEFLIDGRDS